jgi:crotonobetainyl-CoA:carnitine CoA-transferase CaiB-like acyl-CoA transferase
MTIFLAEGLAGDRFLTTQQALDHPQVRHNGSVVELSDPELGPTLQLGMMASFSVSPGRVKGPAAGIDQHSGALAPDAGDAEATGAPAAGRAPAGPDRGPLAGLTVLEFASWLAGPYGTSLLADLGARVIKVESPTGDDGRWSLGGRTRTFQGKESLVIDLKRPEGQEVVAKLLGRADGLMHNMRGDAAARLGVDYESARRHNPEIVYLYAGSYGSSGPGAGRVAFHPTMGALSGGVLRQIGRGNEPPAADVELDGDELYAASLALGHCNEASPDITGALAVATAMTMGFLHRARTGKGQYIESTMLASNLYLCSEDAIRYEGQAPLAELDGDLRGLGPLDRLYATGSGWLLVSCHTQAEWELLCDVVGRPDLVGQERFADAAARCRFGDQLIAELSVALGARTADEWEGLCLAAGVGGVRADAMNGDDFFLTHPQVAENGFIVEVGHPGVGTYHRSNCGVRFSRTPGVANAAHQFGQDGAAILGELGYDDETVAQWVKAGVVVLPEEGSGA